MSARIVLFGATGYTGRLTAERLAAAGAEPVLAGRDEDRLSALADRLGGLPWVRADALRQNTVFAAVREGDVLVAEAAERVRYGRSGVYDVTVRRGEDVVAEFRGQSRATGRALVD